MYIPKTITVCTFGLKLLVYLDKKNVAPSKKFLNFSNLWSLRSKGNSLRLHVEILTSGFVPEFAP